MKKSIGIIFTATFVLITSFNYPIVAEEKTSDNLILEETIDEIITDKNTNIEDVAENFDQEVDDQEIVDKKEFQAENNEIEETNSNHNKIESEGSKNILAGQESDKEVDAKTLRDTTEKSGVIGNVRWIQDNNGDVKVEPIETTDGQISKSSDLAVLKTVKGEIVFELGVLFPEDSRGLFSNFEARTFVFNNNTSNVTNMDSMFSGTSNITMLDLSSFNTSNVKSMSSMFSKMGSLETINLSSFNTSNVTLMNSMFNGSKMLKNIDLSNFNTSNVTSMNGMFLGAQKIDNLDLTSFDTKKVLNTGSMFMNMTSLKSVNLSSFKTDSLRVMSSMFSNAKSLETVDLSNFNTSSVHNMSDLFSGASALQKLDLSTFDTGNVTNMDKMFYDTINLSQLNISSFNTSKVTTMKNMFDNNVSLESLDLSSFDTSNVVNMQSMFSDVNSLRQITLGSKSLFGKATLTKVSYDKPYNGKWFHSNDKVVTYGSLSELLSSYSAENAGTYYIGKTFNVNFYVDDVITSQAVDDKEMVLLNLIPDTTKIGYSFVEWNTATDGSGISFDPYTDVIVDDITLYAIYNIDSFNVSFNYNGESTIVSVDYNSLIDHIKVPEVSKKGHTFVEWNTELDGNGTTFNLNTDVITDHITLYAIYDINTYKVSFNYEDSVKHVFVNYDCYIDEAEIPEAIKEGHTFVEWNTELDGTGKVIDPVGYVITADLGVYAVHEIKTFKVIFDLGDVTKQVDVDYNTLISVVDIPNTVKKGYTFVHWNTRSDGSGEIVDPLRVSITGDTTYYAIYEEAEYNTDLPNDEDKSDDTNINDKFDDSNEEKPNDVNNNNNNLSKPKCPETGVNENINLFIYILGLSGLALFISNRKRIEIKVK